MNPAHYRSRLVARAVWVYTILIAFSLVVLGPFLLGTLTSFKDNPLEYPPTLSLPKLDPGNMGAAYRLGVAGGGGGFFGELQPGAEVPFEVSIFTPAGQDVVPPVVQVLRLQPGAGIGAVRDPVYAADFATVQDLKAGQTVSAQRPDREGKLQDGTITRYTLKVVYPHLTQQQGEKVRARTPKTFTEDLEAVVGGQVVKVNLDTPEAQQQRTNVPADTVVSLIKKDGQYYLDGPIILDRTPLNVELDRGQQLTDSTLPPTKVERFGRANFFNNITPGIMGFTFNNYLRAFRESVDLETGNSIFLRWVGNSFLIAIVKVLTSIAFASMAGYAFARLQFPGKNLLFVLVLFTMMVPMQVTFLSNFLLLRDGLWGLSKLFGLPNFFNPWGLIVSGLVGSAQVFLMKQFFESLPRELDEAAAIDGASAFQSFWYVTLPQTLPAIATLAITTFQGSWNDFFWPSVVVQNPASNLTLPVGLANFRQAYAGQGDYGLILAGAVISAIPIILLFLFFQRYFVESSVGSAVKG
ncbi:carbohydrate ABC transporter permease [Deinococcus roseus]|uniref:ABC transmembrane type-1 domain-containing protein n=1 Tax=Deinococcus roseus TaxID=392414 RepID=A0ABQ2D3R1_9DEIO|nr:carbohydrate ABC transporter permease [Deinococcus roseus]GGJ36639.1 hypothetical protein GCM10008938_23460 [Deinococcus roseus]